MQFIELASPFAIFERGSAYVLPNVLPEMARNILKRLEEEPIDNLLTSLRGLGQQILSRKTSAEDAARVWNFFVHYYLMQADPEAPSTVVRIEMLRLMVDAPPAEAWKALRARILADIDDLSGWSRSIRKELAERHQVWLGKDGNYYGKESDGAIYQVIGAPTLEEARLDFLTEQITRDFGVIRIFLQLFSWLMIAQDFVEHGNAYHNSMKAVVQDRQWPSLNHRWSLLQWHAARTVIWRPWSNLCDPQWLAGDLLAAITDTLETEPYRPTRIPGGSHSQLGPGYERQMDFALDTQLRIGDEEAIILQFEGREYRWINASLESDTRVSVGLKKGEDRFPAEEEQSAARLTQERERVAQILQNNPRISEYLDNNCRNAVVHVFRPPFVNPDSSEDFVRLSLDLPIVRSLAKVAMRTLPAFS